MVSKALYIGAGIDTKPFQLCDWITKFYCVDGQPHSEFGTLLSGRICKGGDDGYARPNFIKEVDCDVISTDATTPKKLRIIAREKDIMIQGDLKPEHLINGGANMIDEIKKTLEKYKDNLHIFNLSHGILPNTPIENVEKTIKIVKTYDFTAKTSKNS